ncbi:hypothetical protein UXO79_00480 [Enterobacter hormaechei]
MSNIDKRALREAAEKHGDDDILALLDELEAAAKQSAQDVQIKARLCRESNSLHDRLREAEKRIAELEGREVKLPEHYDIEICPTPSPHGEWYSCEDVLAALKAAGIKFVAGTGNMLKE